MSNPRTWIIYRTNSLNAAGWEDRILSPSGSLTSILAEEHDYSGKLPQVGDRVRDYENLEDPGNGITHGKDGDWVVSQVQAFSSFETSDRVVVCHCIYAPITPQWEPIERGAPIQAEIEATVTA